MQRLAELVTRTPQWSATSACTDVHYKVLGRSAFDMGTAGYSFAFTKWRYNCSADITMKFHVLIRKFCRNILEYLCFQIPVFPQVLVNYHDENACPYSEILAEISGMCFQIRQVLFAQVLCIFWPAAESPTRRRGRSPRCLDLHVILKEHIPTYLRDLFNVIVQSFALMASYQYC